MKKIILLNGFFFLSMQLFASELEKASRLSSGFSAVSSSWGDEVIKGNLPDVDVESEVAASIAPSLFVPILEEQRKAFLDAFGERKERLLQACDKGIRQDEARQETIIGYRGDREATVLGGVARSSFDGGTAFAFLGAIVGLVCAPVAGLAAVTALAAGGATIGVVSANLDLYQNTASYRMIVSERIKILKEIKSDLETLFESRLRSDNGYSSEFCDKEKNLAELEEKLARLDRTQEIIGRKKLSNGKVEIFFIS